MLRFNRPRSFENVTTLGYCAYTAAVYAFAPEPMTGPWVTAGSVAFLSLMASASFAQRAR